MKPLFPKPLALAGYRFRRSNIRADLVLLEIVTRKGEVPICMTTQMLEQLALDTIDMAAKLGSAKLARATGDAAKSKAADSDVAKPGASSGSGPDPSA